MLEVIPNLQVASAESPKITMEKQCFHFFGANFKLFAVACAIDSVTANVFLLHSLSIGPENSGSRGISHKNDFPCLKLFLLGTVTYPKAIVFEFANLGTHPSPSWHGAFLVGSASTKLGHAADRHYHRHAPGH